MTSSSTLDFVDWPRMAIVVTSANPIINADAVAAVRRGLRRAFSLASNPTVPNSLGYPPAITATIGRLITGLSRATPMKTASTPPPSGCNPPSKASAQIINPAPTTVSATPPSSRRCIDDSGIETSSRIAATGGTRAALRAGR